MHIVLNGSDSDGQGCIPGAVENPGDTHVLRNDRTIHCEDLGELPVPPFDGNESVPGVLVGSNCFHGGIRYCISRDLSIY